MPLIDSLFPQFCKVCENRLDSNDLFCERCANQLPRVMHACKRCGQGLKANADYCGRCLANACPQDVTFAPFWFESILAQQIKQFKYLHKPYLARPLTGLLLGEIPLDTHYTAIIPIPSTRNKLIERGFNPAAQLAFYIGKELNVRVFYHLLLKRDSMLSQVGSTRAQRLRQPLGQFNASTTELAYLLNGQRRSAFKRTKTLPRTSRVRQKDDLSVLLIDDVLTTGATLHAAAKLLKAKGIEHITAICLALSP